MEKTHKDKKQSDLWDRDSSSVMLVRIVLVRAARQARCFAVMARKTDEEEKKKKKQSHLIDTDDGSIVPVSQLPQLRAQGGQMLSSDDQVLVVIVTAEQSCHRVHHHQLDFATSQCHRQLFLQAYLQGILKSQQADGTTVLLCLVFYSLCKILLTAGTKPKESETRFI